MNKREFFIAVDFSPDAIKRKEAAIYALLILSGYRGGNSKQRRLRRRVCGRSAKSHVAGVFVEAKKLAHNVSP
jgi:hypothetical protein